MKIERVEQLTIAESVIKELEKLKDKKLEKKFKKAITFIQRKSFPSFP